VNEHIFFKLATRSRPIKAKAAIDNIIANCNSMNYTILVSIDVDDLTMKNFKYKDDNVFIIKGTSKNKIDAINRDMDIFEGWKILINTSDDMVFNIRGFDEIIRQDFNGYYDQVLHYSDGYQKGNLMTMSIMGVDYYKRFNYIYHPDYKSLWCDMEATEVAHMLNKYKYMGDEKQLFTHMHPAWGLAEFDDQYRKTESHEVNNHDKALFNYRKSENYFLPDHLIINPHKY
jgi:hypothetical protein